MRKSCNTCAYRNTPVTDKPCKFCKVDFDEENKVCFSKWTAAEKKEGVKRDKN